MSEADESPETKAARNDRHKAAGKLKGVGGLNLETQAQTMVAPWETPKTSDEHGTREVDGRRGVGLNTQVGWATPSARDHKDTPGMATTGTNPDGSERSRLDQLPRQAALAEPGSPATGSPASTGKRGRLNPALSRWLMGYPKDWDDCAMRAHRSIPPKRG